MSWRECSKKSVQQGRSHFDARNVHEVHEHGKMARTPLAAFFNIPKRNNWPTEGKKEVEDRNGPDATVRRYHWGITRHWC